MAARKTIETPKRAPRPCRRAAGRRGRIARAPVCGAGGQVAARDDGGGWPHARARVSHECGEALQVRAARQKRLHQRPTAGEVERYRWWLGLELDFVDPKLVVALGATAVRALAGKPLPIEANRGPIIFGERQGYITVHPSALLRIPEQEARRAARAAFLADLKKIKALAAKTTPRRRA